MDLLWEKCCDHSSSFNFEWISSFLHTIRTTIKAWMSLNFGKIPSLTSELAALERQKN